MGRRKIELVDPLAADDCPPVPEPIEFGDYLGATGESRILVGTPDTWTQETAEEAAALLARCEVVFLDRTGALVWVDDRAGMRAMLRQIEPAHVPDLLGRIGVVFREQKGMRKVQISAPTVLCQTLVSRRSPSAGWRSFAGFAPGPYVLGDGRLVSKAGFHPAEGLWLPRSGACEVRMPAGPPPDAAEARELLDALLHEMREFPWADPTLDPAVWLAYLLTLITRPAYPTAPLFLFDASRPRTGKDLLEKCAAVIAYGQGSARLAAQRDPEELRKGLGTLLREGESVIVIGDAKMLGDATLLQLITEQTSAKLRILGVSESIPIPRVLVLAATGNNIKLAVPDLLPRVLHCRVESAYSRPSEAPHERSQEQLLAHLLAHRPLYLGMAVAAVQGYLAYTGEVPKGRIEGSFPGWASIVRDALLWCGYPDVLASRLRLAAGSAVASEEAIDAFVAGWWRFARDQLKTAAHLVGIATYTGEDGPDMDREVMAQAMLAMITAGKGREERSPRAQAIALSAALEGHMGAVFEVEAGVRVKLSSSRPHNHQHFQLVRMA